MKTKTLLLLFCLILPVSAYGQSTTVSGIVQDVPDSQTWNNGTITFTFSGGNPPYRWSGGAFNPNTPISGTMTSGGTYSVSVPDNNQIFPLGSQWKVTACPSFTPPAATGCSITYQTITGNTQTLNISPVSPRFQIPSTPQANLAPLVAYADSEILGAYVGFTYQNVSQSTPTPRVCQAITSGSCTTWNSSGNPDPPVSQAYTLTSVGAQTGINLTGAPIDTQSIQWRLSGAGPLTDTVPYANGDLHASNASWVYDTGTFTVSGNTIYGSSAAGMTHRSDGANTGAEFAQAAMVLPQPSATQNNGPCVRIQSGANSGYCIQAASDIFKIVLINAGAITVLQTFSTLAASGDVLRVTANGTTISAFRNGLLAGTATDSTFSTGFTGLFNAGNSTSNGVSSFLSGPLCQVQLDSSPDNVNWTAGGAIASQDCTTLPNGSAQATVVANYVRVNPTVIPPSATLTVIYSGRLAPTANNTTASVTNGQSVNAGEVLWSQLTSNSIGTVGFITTVRILQPNGTITNNFQTVSCTTSAGGVGYGYIVPASGALQSIMSSVQSAGVPQGAVSIQHYILPAGMPVGGTTNSCTGALALTKGATLLSSAPTGSFFPMGFTGTTLVLTPAWSIPGYTTTLTQANPAAGADFSFTAPTTARACIQSVSFTLVTSATAANRVPAVVFTINGSKLVYSAATAQAASLTQVYSFSPGATAETVTTGSTIFHIVPFNNGQLACFNSGLSTATLTSLTAGLQAGDQYSNISFLVQLQQDNN